MNNNLTEIVFILDRSGSMAGLEDDTIGGFNAMVEKQKKEQGEAVLSARAKKGYTQKQLSEATGIDQSDISKIERGVANPSISTLNKIAMALGMQLYVSIA